LLRNDRVMAALMRHFDILMSLCQLVFNQMAWNLQSINQRLSFIANGLYLCLFCNIWSNQTHSKKDSDANWLLGNDRVITALTRHSVILMSLYQLGFNQMAWRQPKTLFCRHWLAIKKVFSRKVEKIKGAFLRQTDIWSTQKHINKRLADQLTVG
jgi:hypothetical protein